MMRHNDPMAIKKSDLPALYSRAIGEIERLNSEVERLRSENASLRAERIERYMNRTGGAQNLVAKPTWETKLIEYLDLMISNANNQTGQEGES